MEKKPNREWLDIKPKGYDFPKTKIPKELKPTGTKDKPHEGATVIDKIKHFFTRLWTGGKDVYETIKKGIEVASTVKIIMYVLLAILVCVILIRLI